MPTDRPCGVAREEAWRTSITSRTALFFLGFGAMEAMEASKVGKSRMDRGGAEVELGVKWYPGSEPESLCSSFESFLEMSVTYSVSLCPPQASEKFSPAGFVSKGAARTTAERC